MPNVRRLVPFHKPLLGKDEMRGCIEALRQGNIVGDGPICRKTEARLRSETGARHVLLTTSGTHALELALMATGIKPGDEVICPSFTFVSTANAILRQGAKPVFADVTEDTLNIDPEDIKRKISAKTRAILPVHYAGVACDMDPIMALARKHRLKVVEDAAQAYGSTHRGRSLGVIGDVGCLSFHQTKNVICGEGGALLTSNNAIARRAEVIREKGTDRSAFMRGEVAKYSWQDVGSSYVLSDLLAAILLVQLSKARKMKKAQSQIFRIYAKGLSELESDGIIQLPVLPKECRSNSHIFYFLLSPKLQNKRNVVLQRLGKRGIQAAFHFVPLHSSPYGKKFLGSNEGRGGRGRGLPITESIGKRLIRLPLYPSLSKSAAKYVLSEVVSALREL